MREQRRMHANRRTHNTTRERHPLLLCGDVFVLLLRRRRQRRRSPIGIRMRAARACAAALRPKTILLFWSSDGSREACFNISVRPHWYITYTHIMWQYRCTHAAATRARASDDCVTPARRTYQSAPEGAGCVRLLGRRQPSTIQFLIAYVADEDVFFVGVCVCVCVLRRSGSWASQAGVFY